MWCKSILFQVFYFHKRTWFAVYFTNQLQIMRTSFLIITLELYVQLQVFNKGYFILHNLKKQKIARGLPSYILDWLSSFGSRQTNVHLTVGQPWQSRLQCCFRVWMSSLWVQAAGRPFVEDAGFYRYLDRCIYCQSF